MYPSPAESASQSGRSNSREPLSAQNMSTDRKPSSATSASSTPMPLRRSHTKSRKGCQECKRRHVKCDEELPKCTLCKKRRLECIYPQQSPTDADSPNGSSVSESGPRSPPAEIPWSSRMLEMRLMQHYLTSTYLTLAQDGHSPYHLSVSIPQAATSLPYLLDSILAFSALHLAYVEPDNRSSWIEAAMKYQSKACSGLYKSLPDLKKPQIETAFVASVFIMLFATGFPVISVDGPITDPVSKVIEFRILISGSAVLFRRMRELGFQGELKGWLCAPGAEERLDSIEIHSGQVDGSAKKLFELHDDIIKRLNHLHTLIDMNPLPNSPLYKTTLQLLHHGIEPWPKIGVQGGIIAWPLFITEEYLSILQDGDWFARILFLYYCVGMRLMCNRWYVRDWSRRLVLGMLNTQGEVPLMWVETIRWMKQAVQIDE